MFGRKKKQVQQPPPSKPVIIFGDVTVPIGACEFEHEGFLITIYDGADTATVKGSCKSCGASTAKYGSHVSYDWTFYKDLLSTCDNCRWLKEKYEKKLSSLNERIKPLKVLKESLLDAFEEFLGKRPNSLDDKDLRDAGMLIHEDNDGFGLVLIDYGREEMHSLVQAVSGQLEPFSRGFQLILPHNSYRVFQGSYGWRDSDLAPNHYDRFDGESYLDGLLQKKKKLITRAKNARKAIKAAQVAA